MNKGFPWLVFRSFLLGQLLFAIPILFVGFYLAEIAWPYAVAIFFVYALFQILWGIRSFSPLGRILEEPLNKSEEPDEWFELQEMFRRTRMNSAVDHEDKDIFESSLQALEDPVMIVDKDKNVKFWNQALTQLSQQDSLRDLHLEEVFRDPDILSLFSLVLSSGELKRQGFRFTERNHMTRSFLLSVVPLKRKKSGDIYGAVGIFNDITDIEKTEIMRIDFVANVSHELRTPLTSMKGYAQAIEGEAEGAPVKKYAQIISKSVDRLIHLVNDLLDLSYLESGIRLNVETVKTREVSESVLVQLETARANRGHEIRLVCDAESVRADRERLEQVLVNLIQNAIKYTPEKTLIEVEWKAEGKEVLLIVRDRGQGIDQEHLPRLFERFYRADTARSPDKGGTGLGLAIVKHIMQRHGGQVSVTSQPGKGTEFICRFPG